MNDFFKIIEDSKVYQLLLFSLLLLTVFWFYDFHHILFYEPQGIHFIRQTDSLAFVKGYFNYDMNFFQPRGLNLSSIDGKGVSEFPILYYITACLYFIFGEHEIILRGLNLVIVSFGLYYLLKLIRELLNSTYYSFVLTFLFFSSTVFVYYSTNFLPDSSALGLTFIGWYFFNDYFENNIKGSLYKSFIFFTISSLLKITFFMHPLSAFLLLVITKKTCKLKTPLLLFIASAAINILWIAFVLKYNTINNNNYFNTKIRPIWNLTASEIDYVFDHIINFWYTKYYFQSTFHLFFVILLSGIFFIRKTSRKLVIISSFLSIAALFYFLLFFEMFQDHDYYFLTVLTTIIFLVVTFFLAIKNRFLNVVNHILTKSIILAICILSINYSTTKLNRRYTDKTNSDKIEYYHNLQQLALKNYSIINKERVILIGDNTQNGGLYYLNTQGWVIPSFNNMNPKMINKMSKSGAKYLISSEAINTDIYTYLEKIEELNNISLYKIK